jgi:tRNA-Thr(GGU) m(6)t(6)A37 methyltransferase TsaA
MDDLQLKPIGIIHSPFQRASDTPIQGAMARGAEGWVEIFAEFVEGLKDLEGFERVWLIYWFDRATTPQLIVKPYLDQEEHGVFATRAPCRPNPIGLSCVRLLGVEREGFRIGEVDILDGTPLLDIKPYVPVFDCFEVCRVGWLAGKGAGLLLADGRFERKD